MFPPATPASTCTTAFDSRDILCVGMHVRVPIEPAQTFGRFREFYLGRIVEIDSLADTVTVRLHHFEVDGAIRIEDLPFPSSWVRRCHLLPGSKVALEDRDAGGVVLSVCEVDWTPGELCDYYIQLAGTTLRMAESNLIGASHRADPDPRLQLANFELQNPSFRQPRNQLVESYAELRAATFGIEDLVGSRIMLLAHQAEVVATVLSDPECRYILADEVGLGKTIEAAVILKGLRRRCQALRALIIAPASLVPQWYFELDNKFWLRFATPNSPQDLRRAQLSPGLILSHEQMTGDPVLAEWARKQPWDLLIVDEAHHIPKNPNLNDYIRSLSTNVARVLLLSATPIQRRSTEFLALLKLLHPKRYGHLSATQFSTMLSAQYELLKIISRLAPDLKPDYFDSDDFCQEMEKVLDLLQHDRQLRTYVQDVRANRDNIEKALNSALAAVAYISENYRIERSVIRNRRVNLQIELPNRQIDQQYAYSVTAAEQSMLDELHEYADALLAEHDCADYAQEVVQLLFHAAFSSPHALQALVEYRLDAVRSPRVSVLETIRSALVQPASPRDDPDRIKQLLYAIPPGQHEREYLDRLLWYIERWRIETVATLDALPFRRAIPQDHHRLVQALCALDGYLRKSPRSKIVIFSSWNHTIEALLPYVRKHIGHSYVFEFHVGMSKDDLQKQVVDFQDVEHAAVLLCDELGGEGRNFQMADLIIHLDLPWAPARLEQRIGRVDRLGRRGAVLSVVPYALDQVEQDIFQIWQEAFELFTRSMSGMEIVMEGVHNEVMASFAHGTRDGLSRILPDLKKRAEGLREQVEEERFYEEQAINYKRREEFDRVSARYADGSILRGPLLSWATQAGLKNSYHPETDTAIYFPRDFSQPAMRNAKFFSVPNMEDALERSRRESNQQIKGTFNRSVAIVREDLVFYAPGSDPWTDAILNNALEADRGRCCAILRKTHDVTKPYFLFDFTYRVEIDPRPLLALGHDPVHLLRAQGYIYTPMHHLLLTQSGARVPTNHKLTDIVRHPYTKGSDVHLGQRSGSPGPLDRLREKFPTEVWHDILREVFASADRVLQDDFSFLSELADEAQESFEQTERGLRAAADWYIENQLIPDSDAYLASIDVYRAISEALVAGLKTPRFTLESVCFWVIQPEK